jgi:hypothetical protein
MDNNRAPGTLGPHYDVNGFTFAQHMALAGDWCRWNGQKGTEKQALRVMRQLTSGDLARMLQQRGVVTLGVTAVAL